MSADEGVNSPMEALLSRQRKEKKDLQAKFVMMKKTAKSRKKKQQKKRKEKMEKMEKDMEERHKKEQDVCHEKERTLKRKKQRKMMFLSRLPPYSSAMTRGRKRKLEEEYRRTFPILKLPNEILYKVYPHLDLASRRTLRVNGRLAGIEKRVTYRYKELLLKVRRNRVVLYCDGTQLDLSVSDAEKEFEFLGKNAHYDEVSYMTMTTGRSDERVYTAISSLETNQLVIHDETLDDNDLQSIVQNKVKVAVQRPCKITTDGIVWIYEKMRDRQLALTSFEVEVADEDGLCLFLERLGDFDRETLVFTPTVPGQRVLMRSAAIFILDANLFCRISRNVPLTRKIITLTVR